ncbi:(4Fe-4S)-binding protein [Deinococcus sp.]|uniref:(4Fe-4S)-binding protein n=1 Tax=Deinococcus sp. TaxID=47478 RepID=UPI0025C7377B|nr:(4Fe-4S)-binding protein [Deinococcus sp.]
MTEIPTPSVPDFWGRAYTAEGITVYYNRRRCIHFAACVRGLPQVFDTQQRPWIQPGRADAAAVAEVVRRCPTGALHYVLPSGPPELSAPTTIDVRENGPNFLRGDLTIASPESADPAGTIRDTRAALCRCGQSGNKPFCDGTHRQVGFQAPGGQS